MHGAALRQRHGGNPHKTVQDSCRASWLRHRARDLWSCSQLLAGTPAAFYLAQRGLPDLPAALRYCDRTPLRVGGVIVHRPAMIAAVEEAETLVAVQRSFLDKSTTCLAQDLGNARRLLGRPCGGAVRLEPVEAILGLAEGIETAISAARLLHIPVWATLGSERMDRITIPACVTHLVLLPDRDRAGARGAAKALIAYERSGRIVEIVWPPSGFKDWNDVLRMEGKGGGMGGAKWTEGSARSRQEMIDHV